MIDVHVHPVTPFEQNCSLLVCSVTKEAVVVDPGGDVGGLVAQLQQLGAKPVAIWLTHAHLDHASATAELAERLQVPIIGPHKDDQFWIDLLPEQARRYGFPPARTFEPSRWLVDGDTVKVGEAEFVVRHCPGHTPGHVVYYNREAAFVVVGDVLFDGSIGRTDFPRGDYATLIRSIRERLLPLGDEVTFLPGHGGTSTLGEQRRTNPFLVHPERYGPYSD